MKSSLFKLIIEAEKDGADKVDVVISDLNNDTDIIPGSETGSYDPFDYKGKYVELFTEHYLNITSRTPPLWFFAASATPSSYYSGWVPDCLIPFTAPVGKGGAPFSIGAGLNQGVWVDILIPRDASAGIYTGDARVTVSDSVFVTIPVSLEVYDFTLPDSTHIYNMFGYDTWELAHRYGVTAWSTAYYNIEARFFQMAHRHRIDLVTNVANLNKMDDYYKRYYTGEIYSSAYDYAGPGENTGNTTFSIGYGGNLPSEYGSNINTATQSSWWAGSDAWENWFVQNAPGVARHKYLFPDEPDWKGPAGALGTGSMDTIKMQADWTHSNPGIGRNIPCLGNKQN